MVTSSLCRLLAGVYTVRGEVCVRARPRVCAWTSRSVSACRLIGSNEPAPRERRLNPPVTERLNDSAVNRADNFSRASVEKEG